MGQLLFVDGSPVLVKKLIQNFVKSTDVTSEKIQLELIFNIMQVAFPGENLENIRSKMEEVETWESKLEKFSEFIKWSQHVINVEHLTTLLNGIYNRTYGAHCIETDNVVKIKSPIVLVRPTDSVVTDIDEDYELQKFTDGLVTLKFIDGNHQSMLENPNLIEIINEMNPNQESRKDFVNAFIKK